MSEQIILMLKDINVGVTVSSIFSCFLFFGFLAFVVFYSIEKGWW